MKKGYTHITVVLDKSGSMSNILDDTIGGYNLFLKKQKEFPGEATFSLVQFNTGYDLQLDFVKVADVPELNYDNYTPRDGTALLDAIGKAVAETGARLAIMEEDERPDKVVFVVLTDGQENSSKEYTLDAINKIITRQQTNYNWEFLFLGANQDAISVAAGMGISRDKSLTWAGNGEGVKSAFESTANVTYMARTGASNYGYTQSDRDTQTQLGA